MTRLARVARKQRDSDNDELPHVQEILAGTRQWKNKATTAKISGSEVSQERLSGKMVGLRDVGRRNRAGQELGSLNLGVAILDRKDDAVEFSSQAIKAPPSIRKKRVLKSTTENPLLKPITKAQKEPTHGNYLQRRNDASGPEKKDSDTTTMISRKALAQGVRGSSEAGRAPTLSERRTMTEQWNKSSNGNPVTSAEESNYEALIAMVELSSSATQKPASADGLRTEAQLRGGPNATIQGKGALDTPEAQCQSALEELAGAVGAELAKTQLSHRSKRRSRNKSVGSMSKSMTKQSEKTMSSEVGETIETTSEMSLEMAPKYPYHYDVRVPKQRTLAQPPTSIASKGTECKPLPKRIYTPQPEVNSDASIDEGESESDRMSDFVVDDTISDVEESFFVEKPNPKPRRRLIKGRRNVVNDSESEEELEMKMRKLNVNDGFDSELKVMSAADSGTASDDRSKSETPLHERNFPSPPRLSQTEETKEIQPQDRTPQVFQDMEDPFTLRYSPSPQKPIKVLFSTPPSSPSFTKKGLPSPTKLPRIPSTPHRPSMDTFWQQDVVNAWHDEYSPKKTPKPRAKIDEIESAGSSSESLFSTKKSSSKKQDAADRLARKSFSQQKEALAQAFIIELDDTITNSQVSHLAASTGGIKIIWSKKLNTTAGRAHWKFTQPKPQASNSSTQIAGPAHHASIELASKIISSPHRLYNTLAHEFCHLATFMISKQTKNPHGKEFKAWGDKCATYFAHRGVQVTTKHSYEIEYRFVWECDNCGQGYKRHSRSIDPARHRCGRCKSVLVQVKPVPKVAKAGTEGKAGEKTQLGAYHAFVRDNLAKVRSEIPGSPHKEVMLEVGRRYQAAKALKLSAAGVTGLGGGLNCTLRFNESGTGCTSRETSVESSAVSPVSRKLLFLDLTSP